MLECPHCNKKFKDAIKLFAHIAKVHIEDDE